MKRLDAYRKSRFYSFFYEKGVFYFLLSFMIPAAIMLLAFRANGFHPFGDDQMLVVDLWHQYFPFFRVVREKLVEGGSFLYSWQNGMGTNFLSLISYYAASPLNWIAALFSEEHARDILMYLLVAKIGFCGAFFSCFLRYTFKRKDCSICIFSTMFALCSYMLGYYWNVMWFDTIALFPLVMMGVVAVAREGKWKTFTFALALSLISNYYVGYFTCIFTVFMFAAAIILNGKGIKDFFVKLWIMIRSSVLGIALGGFILLPAYYGLQLTHSAKNSFPTEMEFYEGWIDIFANMLSYNEPAMKEGLPNFACGMLAIVLFGVFLFSSGIKIREKISALLMLAVIAVSCNMNILNYIWHGFHFTNMIPYRFAFIFSFVLIVAAFRAFDVILTNGVKIYQIIMMFAFPWVIFYLNYMVLKGKGEAFSLSDKTIKNSLIICGAFILIFIAVKIFPFTNPKVRNAVLSLCIGAAVISECYSNAGIGVTTVGNSDYASYMANNEDIQILLDQAEETEESLFYRTEMTRTWTLNDSALYGYNGISQFSSSANVSVTRFLRKLGLYGSEAGNRFYYRISTPVVNSMLGIKYLVNKNGAYNGGEMDLTKVGQSGTVYMYENNYPLSLGYMVNSEVLELENTSYLNPFEFQNSILRACTDIGEDVFTAQPVTLASYDGITVTKTSYGDYNFGKENSEDKDCSANYKFSGVEDSYLYGYVTNGGMNTINVTNDGISVDTNISVEDYPIVFPMGNAQEGETASVELKVKEDTVNGNFKLMVYALSQPKFEQAYSQLADEQLQITEFSDTEINGTITALKDGVMFLSIPYEDGWSVYVDGEKAETCKVLQAMLGVEVSEGTHDIRIVYTPEGFTAGVIATGTAAVLCVVIGIIDFRRRKNKKNAEPEEAPEPTEDMLTEADGEENAESQENPVEAAEPDEAQEESPGADDAETAETQEAPKAEETVQEEPAEAAQPEDAGEEKNEES
ncbi:MAG: YfhO family protein [Ruminococcus sp.]|nr:YfhO family protein [Ruminococcus sp.]